MIKISEENNNMEEEIEALRDKLKKAKIIADRERERADKLAKENIDLAFEIAELRENDDRRKTKIS